MGKHERAAKRRQASVTSEVTASASRGRRTASTSSSHPQQQQQHGVSQWGVWSWRDRMHRSGGAGAPGDRSVREETHEEAEMVDLPRSKDDA